MMLSIRIAASIGMTALSAAAGAANFPLSFLNGGPSSDSVPSSPGDRVATVVYPREISDTVVVPAFGDLYPTLADATAVEASGNTGIRWRSAALWPANQFNNNLGQVAVMAITDGFDATAADSFILFLNEGDAAGIIDMQSLASFIANNSAGTNYIRFFLDNDALNGFAGYADGDLTEAALDEGIIIDKTELDAATPDGGGRIGQYAEFTLAIVVFSDGAFTGATSAVATEWICVDNDAETVAPSDAEFDFANQTIRIQANQQLVDDFNAENPADTNIVNIGVSDFRVLLSNDTTVQTLANFLNSLAEPRTVVSIHMNLDDNQARDVLEITLNTPVTNAIDINTILATRIGFLGVDIDSITGDNQSNATSTYQFMDRPPVAPCPGDIDGDGFIGFGDLNAVLSSYNTTPGDPAYNGAADLDGDDFVGFSDLNIVLGSFNTACP